MAGEVPRSVLRRLKCLWGLGWDFEKRSVGAFGRCLYRSERVVVWCCMDMYECKMWEKTHVVNFGEEFAVGLDSGKVLPTRLTNQIQHDGGAIYSTCVLFAMLLQILAGQWGRWGDKFRQSSGAPDSQMAKKQRISDKIQVKQTKGLGSILFFWFVDLFGELETLWYDWIVVFFMGSQWWWVIMSTLLQESCEIKCVQSKVTRCHRSHPYKHWASGTRGGRSGQKWQTLGVAETLKFAPCDLVTTLMIVKRIWFLDGTY